jgi:hypothetical protein
MSKYRSETRPDHECRQGAREHCEVMHQSLESRHRQGTPLWLGLSFLSIVAAGKGIVQTRVDPAPRGVSGG